MKETINNIKLAWYYTKEHKGKFIKYILINILLIAISIIIPILSAQMIIKLTDNQLHELILIAISIYLIENIRNLIFYKGRHYANIIHRESQKKLGIELGEQILKLSNKTLYENGSGLFIERLSGDTSRISDIFNTITWNLTDIITNIGIFAAIFIINKYIFLYTIISTIIIYLIDRKRVTIRNEQDKIFRKTKEKVLGIIGELVRGCVDIKMLNSEKSFLSEFKSRIDTMNNQRYEMNKIDRRYNLVSGSTRDLSDLLLIILMIIMIDNKLLTIASALIIYNYSGRISNVIYFISAFQESLKDFNLSSSRVFDIINNNKFEKETFGEAHIDKVKGNFSFKNVSFSYKDKKVLKDISFDIHANETVAFVGKSGAGKTTIFNLLCKMYNIDAGEILIDGININKLDKDSIRSNITIISQNPYIFNMSIKDNLRLVKENITDKEIKEVCKLACLDEFIESLPDKYNTLIGEGGVNLSGGQKQRLAIARALIQKTEIILFDEATSALDNETQEKITTAINNLKGEYTILIIAHRLSTTKNANRILYLENGKITASGTHKELLKQSKSYQKLYEKELKN